MKEAAALLRVSGHAIYRAVKRGDIEAIHLGDGQKPHIRITLAETGLRVGELHALECRDVDEHGSRFRIRSGKTAAARRWVAVPDPLMAEIGRSIPARRSHPAPAGVPRSDTADGQKTSCAAPAKRLA